MKHKVKRIAKYTAEDIAGVYPYVFCFYILSLLLSFLFESWKLFFYWPAFDAIIIIFGIIYIFSERGRETVHKVHKVIKLESYKIRQSKDPPIYKVYSVKSHKINEAIKLSSYKIEDKIIRMLNKMAGAVKTASVLFFIVVRKSLKKIIDHIVLKIRKLREIEYIKIGIIIIILGYAVNNKTDIISFLILAYALFSILFIIESRIAAGFALILLISVPFLMIAKKDIMAEQMAIYTYYFLVITVLTQIREFKKS